MPLKVDKPDREVLTHIGSRDPAYGELAKNRECGAQTNQPHTHPIHGRITPECNLERGHIGRHEFVYGRLPDDRRGVIFSWANAPFEPS